MRNFCTLFDSNYLTRGLALYNSLMKYMVNFHIYVYTFDEIAYDVLKKLDFKNMTIISLSEFEDEELLKVKAFRSKGEYCWTCTPSIILNTIKKYKVPSCVYLDSDIYFFSSPEPLIKEVEDNGKEVLITEHRYTPEYNQESTSGRYCVQFMYFKNSEKALRVLNWWRERCLEWCYARFEDGKFGDQKYLDDWLERFECVHSLNNIGGGVAPWNIQQYKVEQTPKVNDNNVIFYHFHDFKIKYNNFYDLGHYRLTNEAVEYIYYPYIDEVKKIIDMVRINYSKNFSRGIESKKGFVNFICSIKNFISRKRKGCYNVIKR